MEELEREQREKENNVRNDQGRENNVRNDPSRENNVRNDQSRENNVRKQQVELGREKNGRLQGREGLEEGEGFNYDDVIKGINLNSLLGANATQQEVSYCHVSQAFFPAIFLLPTQLSPLCSPLTPAPLSLLLPSSLLHLQVPAAAPLQPAAPQGSRFSQFFATRPQGAQQVEQTGKFIKMVLETVRTRGARSRA